MVRYAYEDFNRGQIIELGTAHVDREEMLAFARAFDPQPGPGQSGTNPR